MQIIRPFTIDDTSLTASNVSETPPAAYSSGTTYALGDQVGDLATHKVYESLAAGNLGNPLTNATKWLDLGANNRWRMFDNVNGSVTSNASSIDVTISVTGRADSVALLNITASTVQIIVKSGATTVYNQTQSLISDSGITDWYAWFFEPIVRMNNLIVTDIPQYGNPTIQVIANEPTGTASIGTMVTGLIYNMGGTVYGARVGILDYSRKTTDSFGNTTVAKRPYSKRGNFKVTIDSGQVDAIQDLLAQYRATPIVYIGTDDYASTWLYGFYKSFDIDISYPTKSFCTLEVEGLT